MSKVRFGVTDEMLATHGEAILKLGLNHQSRTGDAVRLLDYDAIEAQRADTGLTDNEVAEHLGLSEDQVRYIRIVMEHRTFNPRNYDKIYKLGKGKRYRVEREENEEH